MSRRWGKGSDANQMQLNWQARIPGREEPRIPAPAGNPGDSAKPLLRLRWDFRTRFPQPTDDAMTEGALQPEDAEPENLAALHSAQAGRMLATLSDIDAVAEAARLGVDPATGREPDGKEGRQRLEAARRTEPGRLQRWYENLLGAYRDWFGDEAAEAFDKAVRAWHARIEVVVENGLAASNPTLPPDRSERESLVADPVVSPDAVAPMLLGPSVEDSTPLLPSPRRSTSSNPARVIARLPVPRPLPEAIAAGDFGTGENGRPINPSPAEVREITANHAEQLVALIDQAHGANFSERRQLQDKYLSGIAAYASSFGEQAAAQLDAYVRRQASGPHAAPAWRSGDSGVER